MTDAAILMELEAWLQHMKLYTEKQYGKQRIIDLRNNILKSAIASDDAAGVQIVREPTLNWTAPAGCVIAYAHTTSRVAGPVFREIFMWQKPEVGFFTYENNQGDTE